MLTWPNLGLLLKKGIAVYRLIYWQSPSILLLVAAAILSWAMPAAPDLVCGLSLW